MNTIVTFVYCNQQNAGSSSSLHDAATQCLCSALYSVSDVEKQFDLVAQLKQGTYLLQSAYHNALAHEDLDKWVSALRTFGGVSTSFWTSNPGVPNLGCMYPWGYICLYEGVHLLYSRNKLTLRHKNGVYIWSSKILNILLKIKWIFVILLSLPVIRYLTGTCSSVEMLKGRMERERPGTPGLTRPGDFRCIDLCQIFSELAETLAVPLVESPGRGLGDMNTVELLLMCAGHHQYEVIIRSVWGNNTWFVC